jgi:membrane protein DedA with SNARE-associated domain
MNTPLSFTTTSPHPAKRWLIVTAVAVGLLVVVIVTMLLVRPDWLLLTLAASTLVSEDAACVAAGVLAHSGKISYTAAIIACTLGIWLGDIGLWLMGKTVAIGAAKSRWIKRFRVDTSRAEQARNMFLRNGAWAIFLARLVPGLRLPMYVAMGSLGYRLRWFALWTLIAAVIWTPLLVMGSSFLGGGLMQWLGVSASSSWTFIAVVLAIALVGTVVISATLRVVSTLASPFGKQKLIAFISLLWRWEFWPLWAFYPPVFLWIGYLMIRHRSLTLPTAVNPCIPLSGLVGESKKQILDLIQGPNVSPTFLIDSAPVWQRLTRLENLISTGELSWPVILKPDAGQRGAQVRKISSIDQAGEYFRDSPWPVIAQPYHPGPLEAGLFYCRFPDQPDGWLFAVTDKVFPTLTGDGSSTLEQLIYHHPRFRMQASRFLNRHDAQTVLAQGQVLRLAMAGNHCQGTLFKDGSHLITAKLSATIDHITKRAGAFHFGRFDVRYTSVESLAQGEFTVLELNGLTSEATNIYDPSWSLFKAYSVLFKQWSLAFEIGHRARIAGAQPASVRELLHAWRAYSDSPHATGDSD